MLLNSIPLLIMSRFLGHFIMEKGAKGVKCTGNKFQLLNHQPPTQNQFVKI